MDKKVLERPRGIKTIKVQAQASYSGYLNNADLTLGEEMHLSIGLFFNIVKKQ